jgi:hypothetical protein
MCGARIHLQLEVLIMWRKLGVICVSALFLAAGLASARDEQVVDSVNRGIKGGIEGKIKTVDVANNTLTIVTSAGKESTFTITEDTTLLGPRGGKVRRQLKDPRFHEGFPLTVVAQGKTASEVHLGFARDENAAKTPQVKIAKRDSQSTNKDDGADQPKPAKKVAPPAAQTESTDKSTDAPSSTIGKTRISKAAPEEDEDNEFPGKVRSFDSSRRILVVQLLNGKDRSFMLANDVTVLVKGTASKKGLKDSALKSGAHITVITDEGGHKVKELEIGSATKLKKAG